MGQFGVEWKLLQKLNLVGNLLFLRSSHDDREVFPRHDGKAGGNGCPDGGHALDVAHQSQFTETSTLLEEDEMLVDEDD